MKKQIHKTSQRFAVILALMLCGASRSLFAARPVARWDVIPDQRVSGVFKAGVCAFHEDGVRVEFSVNGKKVFTAAAPSHNDRTGVWEYVFPLNTAGYADGEVTLGAVAVTLGAKAESYALPDLHLYANGHGSLSVKEVVWVDAQNGKDTAAGSQRAPLRTLQAAMKKVPVGGTVNLQPGIYPLGGLGGKDRKFWTTIQAAPGVKREDVQLSAGRPGANRLHFKGVTLFCDAEGGYAPIVSGENGATCCWLDDCVTMNKKGRWAANGRVFGNRMVGYVTGGITTELDDGPGCTLQRNHTVKKISSDVWTGSDCLVVNCTSEDVDPGKTGSHPDFHQSHAVDPGWVHDVILYNVSGYNCKSQGLFGVRLRDSAFVNIVFERHPDTTFYSQYSGPMENVIFAHITLINQTWLWREGYAPTDVRVFNNVFSSMGGYKTFDGTDGLFVSHNAFYATDRKGKPTGDYGLECVHVERSFVDEAARNYHLASGSAALTAGRPLQCVPADIDGKLYPAGARPCGAYAPLSALSKGTSQK